MGSDGDNVEIIYKVNSEKEGFVNVTSVDTINNIVAGEFEIFLAEDFSNETSHPDHLEITEGRFEVEIIN